MMENSLFIVLMSLIAVGLALMVAALIQFKRQGGFQQATALGRYLFFGALACFALALMISFFD